MERVEIHTLVPGRGLGAPLYDCNQKLLLAEHNELTIDMLESLLRSGVVHAYLGKWDPEEVARMENAKPLSAFKKAAEHRSQILAEQMEKCMQTVCMDVTSQNAPMSERIDDSVQKKRTSERFKEWEDARAHGMKLVKDIVTGMINEIRVAGLAEETVDKLIDTFESDRSLLNNLNNSKDESSYLYVHSINVAVLSINIATAMGFDRDQIREIGMGALLQDVSMTMVPDEILNANRKLTQIEFLEIQKHTYNILYSMEKMAGLPFTTQMVAYQAHERLDGTGYPRRRNKRAIHKFAQITSVADVYDAMTSDRPWRKAHHPYRVMEYLIREAGKKKYDPDIVRGLLKYLSLFPIGCIVKLTSGETAKVVHSNKDSFDKPVVCVLFDSDGRPSNFTQLVDLSQEEKLRVESVIEDEHDIEIAVGF